MTEPTCRCAACAKLMAQGERPNPGISVLADVHVTAAEMPPSSLFTKQDLSLPPPEHFVSTSKIEATVCAAIGKNNELIERAVGTAIGTLLREVEQRIEARISGLQTALREFRFVQWSEGKTFRAGNICSVGGAVYACTADTETRPPDSSGWVLLIAKPRDGKDGKDFTPPPPAPGGPRMVRSQR